MKDVITELTLEITKEIEKIEDLNQRAKISRTLGLCAKLEGEGNLSQAKKLLQIIITQLKIDFPDFYREDDLR